MLDDKSNCILISHKAARNEESYYIPIGGTEEERKSFLEAAKREVFEETGYFCDSEPTHIGDSKYFFIKNKITYVHQIAWYFLIVSHFDVSKVNFTEEEVKMCQFYAGLA